MHIFRFGILYLFLAVCCLPVAANEFDNIRDQENFVPWTKVKQELDDKTYACFDFDPKTRTCLAIAQRTIWRFKSALQQTFLVISKPRIVFTIITQNEDIGSPDGFVCSTDSFESIHFDIPWKYSSNTEIQEFAEGIKALMIEGFSDSSISCDAHFREGDGFLIRSYDQKGVPVPDYPTQKVKFTDLKYKLRVVN